MESRLYFQCEPIVAAASTPALCVFVCIGYDIRTVGERFLALEAA
jgi:hypothetical protein